MEIEYSTKLASVLVDLFFPLVESTLIDTEGSINEIFNAFSHLKEDQQCDVENCQMGSPYLELLAIGRNVRCLIYPIYQQEKILGYLRLRYDLTHFKGLQDQLDFILQSASGLPKHGTMDPWKEAIDQLIAHFLNEKKITLKGTTAKQKRELISRLQEKGLFDFKESSAYVASKIQISRATVYNYIKTSAHLKKIHIHQVDAFTNQKFGGNPAGVVLDAEDLDEPTMRKIARELNLSETAFVLPSKQGTFRLRYFTPTGHEITFCGHSTVGALFMIANERRFGVRTTGTYFFEVETLCGILKMEAIIDEAGEIRVAYETPSIKLKQANMTNQMIAQAAGFDLNCIDQTIPAMYEETNKDLYVVIKSLEDLRKIECDPKTFAAFSKQNDVVALCLLTPAAFDKENQLHMRCFAPLVGIPEDPFTGSVLGGLTALVDMFHLLPKNKYDFRVEQGHFIERPGVVKVEFSNTNGRYTAKVFAQAVHCFSTEINLT